IPVLHLTTAPNPHETLTHPAPDHTRRRNKNFEYSSQLTPHHRGHPVGCTPRGSGFKCLTLELMHCRRCRETGPVVETVHVYHRARRSLQARNRCNEHATAATDHEIGAARTEAIKLDERPILGRDLK